MPDRELEDLEYAIPYPHIGFDRVIADGGVRFGKSVLLASDRGEFGGEMVYVDAAGHPSILIHDRILFVFPASGGHVVVTGLAHMGSNYGRLYRLELKSDGTSEAREWQKLPSRPRNIEVLSDGNLLITTDRGKVIVTAKGEFRPTNEMPDEGSPKGN